VAGCHGGGEGGRGACGGTGQPASATGAEVVEVVVEGAGRTGGLAGSPAARVAGAAGVWREGAEPATRLESFETEGGGGEPDVAANVATDTMTATSTIAAAGHQRFSPRDKGTSHSRELPVGMQDTRVRRCRGS
jgi:hypothetical protein